jgi:putative transposase
MAVAMMDLYPKRNIAEAFDISRGTLYYKATQPAKDKETYEKIQQLYEVDDTMGCRKLAHMLGKAKGAVARVMLKYDIKPRRKRPSYKYPGKADDIVSNLLREKEIEDHKVLFTDLFQFRLADGTKVYCCFIIRKNTRQILAFCYGYGMPATMVTESINRLDLVVDLTETEFVLHSDQGSQYGAKVTVETCLATALTRSMSRAGTPTDNPFAERFVETFKLSVTERYRYGNLKEFVAFATKWLNFYNEQRPHDGIGGISPNEFARRNGFENVPYLYLNFV